MAQIIFLHGASSSGKSTLAGALQNRLPRPFWHVSFDTFRDSGALPMARFTSGEFDWDQHRARVFDGLHASFAALADTGNDLIVEHILDTPGWAEALHRCLASHDVLFVGVQCALETLQAREATRGDRPTGSAARDFDTIHRARVYDLEVAGDGDLSRACDQVIAALDSGRRVSEFAR
ncbi:MAG: chloramphenicol phosphotransferase CPT family protein [Pelagimonas sp.]|jgi:chloramphenicol 3-O phosphotransferase|nr:chloramphenicol phosphotransferase CPT family protein [Pelagimonas sp.]